MVEAVLMIKVCHSAACACPDWSPYRLASYMVFMASHPSGEDALRPPSTYDNCEPLNDELQVSWTVDQMEDRVFFQLCGCVDAGDYMAFGLSGRDSAVQMVGADAVVTWHNSEGTGAVDYYLASRAQVSGAMLYIRDDFILYKHTLSYIYTLPLQMYYQVWCVCVCMCACVCLRVCVRVVVHYNWLQVVYTSYKGDVIHAQ